MTIEAITTFVKFTLGAQDKGHYQNSNTTTALTYDFESYDYLQFIYNGATRSTQGDNIESLLTLAANQLSLELAHEAVVQFWAAEVNTVLMDPTTFLPSRTLTTENWLVSSMNYNAEGIQLRLITSIDAVSASVPNKVLLEKTVGSLPVTARISNI